MATPCIQEALRLVLLLLKLIWVQDPPEPKLSMPVKLEEPAWSALVSGDVMPAPTLGAPKSCPSEIHESCGW